MELDPVYGTRQFKTVKTVRTPYDIPEFPRSDILYNLDFAGLLEMEYAINVPAGGLYLRGSGYELTGIGSTADAFTLFTGATAGNIFLEDLYVEVSGAGSRVFNCTDGASNEAVRLVAVNFYNCSSLGELTNYRQIEGNDVGIFGGKPELTLSGSMNGFFIEKFLVRSLDADFTGSMFKAGTALTLSNRFRTNMRADIPANASISDMSSANFLDSSLLQINGGSFARNGVIDSGDNQFFPNLDPEDLVCEWIGNNGLRNTHVGGRLTLDTEAETVVTVSNTFYDVAGTWTASNLQHFSSPTNGQLRNDGKNPQEFVAVGSFIVADGPNNVLNIKLVKWSEADQQFVDVHTVITQVLANTGVRDVALVDFYYPVTLEVNDYVKLQVANLSGTSNITFEVGSYLQIIARA